MNSIELLAQLQSKQTESNQSTESLRQRTNAKTKSTQNKPNEVIVHDYTEEQKEMCERIIRCKDYYEVLCVTKEATDSEIKRAYKKLALQLHPDKNHAPGSVEAFKSLGHAAASLTDSEKRKQYDLYGNEATAASSARHYHTNHEYEHVYRTAGSGFDSDFTAEELFNMFFGNGFPQTRQTNTNHNHFSSRRGSTVSSFYRLNNKFSLLINEFQISCSNNSIIIMEHSSNQV